MTDIATIESGLLADIAGAADEAAIEAHLADSDGFDRADREFNKVLNDDPYNTAARRGMEENERFKMNYYDAAYDHTRAKMLREVARGWEAPVPQNLESGPNVDIPTDTATMDIRRTEEKPPKESRAAPGAGI